MAEVATIIDLVRFCAAGDGREYLNAPWRDRGHLYATNGSFCVEIEDDGRPVAERGDHPDVPRLLAKHAEHGMWTALPALQPFVACGECRGRGLVRMGDCEDCDGKGEFSHGLHEYTCKECDGRGRVSDSTAPEERCSTCDGIGEATYPGTVVSLPINNYATRYLRVLSTLPGLRIAETTHEGPLVFEFEGGRGLLMPVRKG